MSAYDFIYKSLSDEDRQKLSEDVRKALEVGAQEAEERFNKAVLGAFNTLQSELVVNPWTQIVEEESNEYEFIAAIERHLWQKILEKGPDNNEWHFSRIIKYWIQEFPGEMSEVCNAALVKENKELREKVVWLNNLVASR